MTDSPLSYILPRSQSILWDFFCALFVDTTFGTAFGSAFRSAIHSATDFANETSFKMTIHIGMGIP